MGLILQQGLATGIIYSPLQIWLKLRIRGKQELFQVALIAYFPIPERDLLPEESLLLVHQVGGVTLPMKG